LLILISSAIVTIRNTDHTSESIHLQNRGSYALYFVNIDFEQDEERAIILLRYLTVF